MSRLTLNNNAASPSAPSAGKMFVFSKTDKKLYIEDEDALVSPLALASGSGAATFTLGSTSIALASTTTTVAGLTLSSPTFSGTVAGTYNIGGTPSLTVTLTLPGSGQISSGGDVGVGASATTARFVVGGTYTTANQNISLVNSTFESSVTSNQFGLQIAPTYNPTGASISNISNVRATPSMSASSSLTVTTLNAVEGTLATAVGYSGTITTGANFRSSTPSLGAGTNPITTFNGFIQAGVTNGHGITSGTVTNNGVLVSAFTAAAGAGGTLVNTAGKFSVPAGSASGNTDRGVWITGNGGASSTKYALYSDSTAPSQLGGTLQFLGATSSFPMLKRSSAELQVRLADDSADGAIKALKITTSQTTFMHETSGTLANGAAAAAGTLLNAPTAGDPTKWIPINDNGTTRYLPAW